MKKGFRTYIEKTLLTIIAEKLDRIHYLDLAFRLNISPNYARMVFQVLRHYGVVDDDGRVNMDATENMLRTLFRIERKEEKKQEKTPTGGR